MAIEHRPAALQLGFRLLASSAAAEPISPPLIVCCWAHGTKVLQFQSRRPRA